ncbi:AI-2E family transporter [Rhodohalobacter sulfatireducens]|uniref:AI-2E family transporter n=1 Tax=Rhodohalobacter sulfatireducens TaxID=2911366 RepID=A0ABS9KFQ5_9BACT|nr:AI-2E family transporter [Rhodohalobacter sulfatireducens]MCG2589655.1 AI-2E family transporter [Rhodohalobacter sulfatireducens]MDR9364514.1 AI-2E family transporter [Balneolaceae bacterium]MDR9407516.1 AI-2E family transporter [Balneolaceae bacterium]
MSSETTWYVKYVYGLAAAVLTVYVMVNAKSVIVPILFSIFFAILLHPVSQLLERFKIPRVLSSFGAILFGIIFFSTILFFFYSQMTDFAQDADMFVERLNEMTGTVNQFLGDYFAIESIRLDQVTQTLINFVRENVGSITQQIGGAASTLTSILLVPIFVFLILLLRDILKKFLLKAFGQGDSNQEKKVTTIIANVKSTVQNYITGVLIVIGILSVLYSILLSVIGVDHAIFFGVFAGMMNIIPFIGPLFGSILPILYALITMDSLFYPLIILLGFYVIQLFEGNLITPVIVGSQVSMNALVTLLLLVVGAQIWGLSGMILFIPIGAIVKVICDEIDQLNHYGYVMGRTTDDKSEERSILAKKVRELSKKAKSVEENS